MPIFWVYFWLFDFTILLNFIIFLGIKVNSNFTYLYYSSIYSRVHPFILQVLIILILNFGSKQLCFKYLPAFLCLFFILEVFLLISLNFLVLTLSQNYHLNILPLKYKNFKFKKLLFYILLKWFNYKSVQVFFCYLL